MNIFISRAVSALCLFLILAEANLWLNGIDNTIFVLGYRLFIIVTPILFAIFRNRLTFFAFVLVEVGLFLWVMHIDLIGTVLISLGLAVSGYMIKYYVASTKKGVSGNKIALNAGSLLSGLLIFLTQNRLIMLFACMVLIVTSSMSFLLFYKANKFKGLSIKKSHFSYVEIVSKRAIAWCIVGFVSGVKLIAIVSILPQFMLQALNGKLPAWYGLMLSLNCLVIIILQVPIIRVISRLETIKVFIPLTIGMMIIMLSYFFDLNSFLGAFIWTFSLSIIECAITYLDKLAREDDLLLVKEAAVGVGSAVTVCVVRSVSSNYSAFLVGSISLVLLLVGMTLFFSGQKKSVMNAR